MKLIFAQGNPEPQYSGTRHNVGFSMLDNLASNRRVNWQEKSKFSAYIAEFTLEGEKVILAKPTTYYNETGQSARAMIDFYKLNPSEDVLVIHDDLALPFGTLRIRNKGSDAGNNGIKSLNAHIGADFRRLRIGTWNESRDRIDDVNFVLGQFSSDERQQLPMIVREVEHVIDMFVSGELADHTIKLELA